MCPSERLPPGIFSFNNYKDYVHTEFLSLDSSNVPSFAPSAALQWLLYFLHPLMILKTDVALSPASSTTIAGSIRTFDRFHRVIVFSVLERDSLHAFRGTASQHSDRVNCHFNVPRANNQMNQACMTRVRAPLQRYIAVTARSSDNQINGESIKISIHRASFVVTNWHDPSASTTPFLVQQRDVLRKSSPRMDFRKWFRLVVR